MSDPASELPRIVTPPDLAPARGYSHGILPPPGARLLFVAGQIAWDQQGRLVGTEFAVQFARCLQNVLAVVREAGGEPRHLLALTIYVTDKTEYLAELEAVGNAYRQTMGRHFPAMALVEVKGLLEPGAKVEIAGVAAIP